MTYQMATKGSGWDIAETFARKAEGGGQGGSMFIRLKGDGDRVRVAFLGEPYTRNVTFDEGKFVAWEEGLRAKGLKPSARFAFNVWDLESKTVKVMELGKDFFTKVLEAKNKYGLDTAAFEVVRKGKPGDMKTTYSVLFDHNLTTEEQAAINGATPHDLADICS